MVGDVLVESEKAYEKHAWILLFASSAVLAIYSILYLFFLSRPPAIVGKTLEEIVAFSPGLASFLKVTIIFSGAAILGLGIFGMVIARISYRKAERWAWYTIWYLPIFTAVGVVVDFSISGSIAFTFIIIVILSLIGQLLSYRKFFHKQS